MSDLDLDRLGDLWRREPDAAEVARLERAAAEVRRRARWAQLVDAGLALFVSAAVLLLALMNPRVESLLAGSAAIVLMLVSSVRQRQLRTLELRGLAGSTEEMLDQSIARLEATAKRARIALFLSPPGFLLGLAFAAALDREPANEFLKEHSGTAALAALAFLAILAGTIVHLVRLIRRSRRELERLEAMRQSYREESEANIS